MPSGEPWQDETDSKYELARRFNFTGKELDIHTGLYDYGARSYDARMGVWLSPDPVLASYMQGGPNYGVYDARNLGVYTYAANAPSVYVDRDGDFFWFPVIVGGVVGATLGGVAAAVDPNATAGSIMAGVLGGGATGAIAAVPLGLGAAFFASGTGMATATSAIWGASVAVPTGFAVSTVVDSQSASISGLYASVAAGGLGGILGGAPSQLATRATFSTAGGRTLLRDDVESAMSAPKAQLAGTIERAGAAAMGAEAGVAAGVQTAVQSGAVAAQRPDTVEPATREGTSGATPNSGTGEGSSQAPAAASGRRATNQERAATYRFEAAFVDGQQ